MAPPAGIKQIPGQLRSALSTAFPEINATKFWEFVLNSKAHKKRIITKLTDEEGLLKVLTGITTDYHNTTKAKVDAAKAKATKVKKTAWADVSLTYRNAFKSQYGDAERCTYTDLTYNMGNHFFFLTTEEFAERHSHGDLETAGPVCAVLPGTMDEFSNTDNEELQAIAARYRVQQVTLTIADTDDHIPRDASALIMQLSRTEDIVYAPDIVVVQRPAVEYTEISIRIIKHKLSAQQWEKVTKPHGFRDYIYSTVNKDYLYPHIPPAPTKLQKYTHLDKESLVQYGIIRVYTKYRRKVMNLSNPKKGLYVYLHTKPGEKDTIHEIIRMPRHQDLDDTLTTSNRLGEIACGVVPTARGYALRVEAGDLGKAKTILDPQLAADVGPELMAMNVSEAEYQYLLKGLPLDLSMNDAVTLMKKALGVRVRPVRFIKGREKTAGTILHIVTAGPMPRDSFQLEGSKTHALIRPFVKQKPSTKWSKALARHNPHGLIREEDRRGLDDYYDDDDDDDNDDHHDDDIIDTHHNGGTWADQQERDQSAWRSPRVVPPPQVVPPPTRTAQRRPASVTTFANATVYDVEPQQQCKRRPTFPDHDVEEMDDLSAGGIPLDLIPGIFSATAPPSPIGATATTCSDVLAPLMMPAAITQQPTDDAFARLAAAEAALHAMTIENQATTEQLNRNIAQVTDSLADLTTKFYEQTRTTNQLMQSMQAQISSMAAVMQRLDARLAAEPIPPPHAGELAGPAPAQALLAQQPPPFSADLVLPDADAQAAASAATVNSSDTDL